VGFLVEPQNQGGGGFSDLGLKITMTVSWFVHQNQVSFGLSVASQNRRRDVYTVHASRSSSLLGVKASLARISQSALKTGGGAITGGDVASSRRLRWRQVKNRRVDATGCVGPCYPTFAVFHILDPRGIVVI
jgi:hypothetical protein